MTKEISLVSAVTADYVPYALIVLRSARKNANFSHFYIFVADVDSENLEKLKKLLGGDVNWISLFGPDDLEQPNRQYHCNCFQYYTPFEVAQLAKYVAVSHVMNLPGNDQWVVFIDSDTYIFDDLTGVLEGAGEKSVILSPHVYHATDNEQLEHENMTHGWVNTGFSAYRKSCQKASDVLAWMVKRTASRAFLAPQLGLSGDQTWGSAIPFLFHQSVHLDQTDGLNVAYWNLHERKLHTDSDGFHRVNSSRLLMFHYSGYSLHAPEILSKHASKKVKHIDKGTTLAAVCALYQKELESVQGLLGDIKKLDNMASCSLGLEARIETRNRILKDSDTNLYVTMPRPGIFSKIGRLADAVVRRLF